MAVCIYVRFMEIRNAYGISQLAQKVNVAAVVSGELFCLGFYTVVSFQSSAVPIVHYVAAVGYTYYLIRYRHTVSPHE